MSDSVFELHLLSCSASHKSVWKQPWEAGLLSHDASPKVLSPKGPMPLTMLAEETVLDGSELSAGQPLKKLKLDMLHEKMLKYGDAIKKPWSKLQDEDRNLAVNKWLQIVLKNPMCFGVARNFFESKTLGFCSGSLSDSIAECMATKATSTLHTRANHFLRYLTWAEKQGVIALPLTEPAVHHYFVLCAGSVAPTAFRSFLSSVGFAKFVVGLNPADPVLLSGRVRGLAAQTYMEKRPLRQREPLLVGEVSRLEEIVTDEARARPDRVAGGYFLFLVYGRARYSDGQRVVRLRLSSCCKHLEAEVERSKSSMTLERKTRLLPITANAEGLKGMQWGRLWFDLLRDEGITVTDRKPLLPAPKSMGAWSDRPLPCDQANNWLRSLLGVQEPRSLAIGTHSCKRTTLSWCSKFGVARDVRCILGYHVSPRSGIGTEILYEADSQATPLRALDAVLGKIRSGAFRPDAARGEQFRESDAGEAPGGDPEDECGDGDMHSSSEDSADEEQPGRELDEIAEAEALGQWHGRVDLAKLGESPQFYRHLMSRVLHLLAEEGGTTFRCGRVVSGAYEFLVEAPRVLYPRCKQCFRTLLMT